MERWGAFAILIGSAAPAGAQTLPGVPPGAVQPAPPVDLARPSPLIRRPGSPLVIRPSPESEAPADAGTTETTIAAIRVEGMTVYSSADIAPLYADLIGKAVPVSALYEAAHRIEAQYRRDGYILARVVVPEQAVGDGRYRLVVVEGYVDAIQLEGTPGGSEKLIRRYLDHITQARPVRAQDIERYLLLANDVPGLTTQAVLTPDAGQTGAATLVVQVSQKAADGYLTVDNLGSAFTGPFNGTLDVGLNGIGGIGGRLEALGFTTLDREQNFGELSFQGQVGSQGARLRAYAAYGPSVPGASLRRLDIFSRSTLFGLGGSYPLIRSRLLNVTLNAALEVTNDRVDILGTPQSRDRQRILRLGVLATRTDGVGVDTAGITLHKGLAILDASSGDDATPQSRPGGTANFFKATATFSRLQTLYATDANSLALLGSVAAQVSANRLLSLEQFRVGGDAFGRGYIPGELSGDDGVGASAELQFTGASPIAAVPHYQLYAFVDYGAVHDKDAHHQELASAGIGVRFDVLGRFSADFALADPFSRGRTESAGRSRAVHGFFRLTARY